MKDKRAIARGFGVLVVFAGAGPLIGGFVFGVFWNLYILFHPTESWQADLLSLPVFAALLGYLAGFAPAAATGLICALLSPFLPGRMAWIGAAVTIGALMSAANLAFLNTGYPTSTPNAGDFAQIMVIGALSALVCARVSANFRPMGRRRRPAS